MPEREPRKWTLQPPPTLPAITDGPVIGTMEQPIRVMELDRERVVPIIEQAQHEWATHFAAGGTRPLSDFVFDALIGGDET